LIITVLGTSCAVLAPSKHTLFTVEKAYYQSWMSENGEKGTDIIVTLVNQDEGLVFESLVFRGIKVKASTELKGNKLIVRGTVNTGPSVIENYEYEVTGAENSLIFSYGKETFVYPLKNIERKKTRFD
jgi:hypothetical protein